MFSCESIPRIGFLGFGRKTFDMTLAQTALHDSIGYLNDIATVSRAVDQLVTDPASVSEAVRGWEEDIDVVVVQLTTFVDGRFVEELARSVNKPVIVWAVREPVMGKTQRLSLNSLTGANMAGHTLMKLSRRFHFIFGAVHEPALTKQFVEKLRMEQVVDDIHHFTVAMLGDIPDGFDFSLPSQRIQEQLGMRIIHLDLTATFQRALELDDRVIAEILQSVRSRIAKLGELPQESVVKFAKMHHTLLGELRAHNAQAVAVRCWPEFFTQFGAAACSTLSILTEDGFMGACEADVLGALSMHVLSRLTASPAYLGDLVEIDEETGSVVFWHCGAGAPTLARSDTGAQAGVHPNRQIGFTMEFGLKPGEVTIFRIGETADGNVRVLVGKGRVLDVPQRFFGTSAKVRLDGTGEVLKRVQRVFETGMEPHYAMAYGDVVDQLSWLCDHLNIPVTYF
ncbi:L-fucose/L-arabinose isomerase family protein [Alicyclobacillus dauci]|uniref:L-fucose isomerase C-terminal domain-containing protein n=1 Tax=Alicyclobacillus dauci TaxID=1475485 RepID=A0ABY6Z650_9BACL|nr:hypothetical protein [Alicyclobacillus dauci]WAH38378.1 hypothetical protein NZD86_07840 [Alicyclobacillus dauci]